MKYDLVFVNVELLVWYGWTRWWMWRCDPGHLRMVLSECLRQRADGSCYFWHLCTHLCYHLTGDWCDAEWMEWRSDQRQREMMWYELPGMVSVGCAVVLWMDARGLDRWSKVIGVWSSSQGMIVHWWENRLATYRESCTERWMVNPLILEMKPWLEHEGSLYCWAWWERWSGWRRRDGERCAIMMCLLWSCHRSE